MTIERAIALTEKWFATYGVDEVKEAKETILDALRNSKTVCANTTIDAAVFEDMPDSASLAIAKELAHRLGEGLMKHAKISVAQGFDPGTLAVAARVTIIGGKDE